MRYPCNRCGRVVTPQPSMCCDPCYKEIDEEALRYADETMAESRVISEQWRREDRALKGGGCALVLLAGTALPFALDLVQLL